MSGMTDHTDLILDGTKIAWHRDRVDAWMRGERIAPITIDMALTRACNYACHFCYAMLQENDRKQITRQTIFDFLDDCTEIGVKGVSFVSDGESTISPVSIWAGSISMSTSFMPGPPCGPMSMSSRSWSSAI